MKKFFKKHIGIVVLLIIVLAFPASMSTQARLNMRIIVTGLAIDKSEDGYEVTAQIVQTQPSSGASDMGAEIDFISDTGETILSAISKLSYKSGKVAGFSHTNFVILGKDMLDENLTKNLNYFLRDTIIKDSVLLLVAETQAKDEIKKTKNMGLSVGLGLQKVYVYKEKESDGAMTSLLDFMNDSMNFSGSAVISQLKLAGSDEENEVSGENTQSESDSKNQEGSSAEEQKTDKSGGEQESETNSESGNESGQGEENTGNSKGSDSEEGQKQSVSFKSFVPLKCFLSGQYKGDLSEADEIAGYYLSEDKCHSDYLSLDNLNFGDLKNAKLGIDIKYKNVSKKLYFDGVKPRLEMCIKIKNSSIKEIQSDEFVGNLDEEEYEFITREMSKKISEMVAKTFEKSKSFGVDIFGAFDIANKFHYKTTRDNFESLEKFLNNLELSVSVKVSRLEY